MVILFLAKGPPAYISSWWLSKRFQGSSVSEEALHVPLTVTLHKHWCQCEIGRQLSLRFMINTDGVYV